MKLTERILPNNEGLLKETLQGAVNNLETRVNHANNFAKDRRLVYPEIDRALDLLANIFLLESALSSKAIIDLINKTYEMNVRLIKVTKTSGIKRYLLDEDLDKDELIDIIENCAKMIPNIEHLKIANRALRINLSIIKPISNKACYAKSTLKEVTVEELENRLEKWVRHTTAEWLIIERILQRIDEVKEGWEVNPLEELQTEEWKLTEGESYYKIYKQLKSILDRTADNVLRNNYEAGNKFDMKYDPRDVITLYERKGRLISPSALAKTEMELKYMIELIYLMKIEEVKSERHLNGEPETPMPFEKE